MQKDTRLAEKSHCQQERQQRILGLYPENVDLASYEKKYPKSLFNKGVRTDNADHVGHVVKETDDKIVVFGHYDYRFDIPKSEIVAAGRNVIVGIDFPELLKYKVERNAPLPTGEPIDKLAEEEEAAK